MAPLLTVRVGECLTAIHCSKYAEQWISQGCHGDPHRVLREGWKSDSSTSTIQQPYARQAWPPHVTRKPDMPSCAPAYHKEHDHGISEVSESSSNESGRKKAGRKNASGNHRRSSGAAAKPHNSSCAPSSCTASPCAPPGTEVITAAAHEAVRDSKEVNRVSDQARDA